MWKSINYHLSFDIVSGQADQFAAVLSPILSTVLINSELADHSLPSSLLPRIQDLMDNILASLETVFDIDNISGKLKRLVVEASYSLSKLFVEYRWLKQYGKQKVFAQSVASRVGEAQDWQNSPAARRLLVCWKGVKKLLKNWRLLQILSTKCQMQLFLKLFGEGEEYCLLLYNPHAVRNSWV